MPRQSRLVSAAALVSLLLLPVPSRSETEEEKSQKLFQSIEWERGPCIGRLGDVAQVQVPAGMMFTGKKGARRWMEATHNLPDDDMLGVVVPLADSSQWWALFEYNHVGHIADDEKDALNAPALLDNIRQGNVQANQERRKRGWPEMEIAGWDREPFYDTRTNNLTWAIRGRSLHGESVNYNVRMLGREGFMSAELILGPEELPTAVGPFETLLAGYSYTPGHRYAEYRKGDKLAAYGLTALVAGGVGAVAAKSGLLGKLWKLIVVAVFAIVAAIRRFFSALFRREDKPPQMPEIK